MREWQARWESFSAEERALVDAEVERARKYGADVEAERLDAETERRRKLGG